MSERYGKERIQRGLIHFVLGKSVSSVAGFLAMLLVIRLLPVESFAAYTVLIAFVEIFTALSGLGLAHVLLRYVPELYALHYRAALRELIGHAVALRSVVLLVAALCAWAYSAKLTPLVGLGDQLMAFRAFLVVVVLRSTTQFLSQILESTLHQGLAQIAFSAAAVTRLLGMLYLQTTTSADLVSIIWVEASSDALGLLIVTIGLWRVVNHAADGIEAQDDDRGWLRNRLRQLSRFAAAGYFQHLAILPYGGNTNRLLGGHLLGVGALANFGFAQTLFEYIQRYLPAQLLVGLIRPIVVARYCANRDFSAAANLCGQVLQINVLLIGIAIALLAVGGTEMLEFISSGKYGGDAVVLLTALLIVLLLETQRQQLELLIQAVEKYRELIPSNILLSCSVILAIALIPALGAIAFPLSNLIGLLVANAWVQRRLRQMGHHYRHDWRASLSVAAVVAASALAGIVCKHAGLPWYGSVMASATLYGSLAYLFCGTMIRSFVAELTPRQSVQLPRLAPAASTNTLKIAFGVLSSRNSAGAIDQLAQAVYPHPVYVHHDFRQQPEFQPAASNVAILSDSVATAWGDWSLVAATFRLMESALTDPEVTHFQLLSEACLPIRAIAEYEDYLAKEAPDIMIDLLRLKDHGAVFSHGWRYLSVRHFDRRVMRRASLWVWGQSDRYRQIGSLNLRLPEEAGGWKPAVRHRLGRLIIASYSALFDRKLARLGLQELAIGGQWFAASRRTVAWLLQARQELEQLTRHYQRCHIPDESYIQTLIWNAQLAGIPLRVYPTNHAMSWRSCDSGPDSVSEQEATTLYSSVKYFARKFPLDPSSPIRKDLLGHLSRPNAAP